MAESSEVSANETTSTATAAPARSAGSPRAARNRVVPATNVATLPPRSSAVRQLSYRTSHASRETKPAVQASTAITPSSDSPSIAP